MLLLNLNLQVTSERESHSDAHITMILLSGGAVSHGVYKAVIPILIPYFNEVYAPDLSGHGNSVPLGAFTLSKSTALLL
jgi:pimeloyl-ACP methyl ester carboxylesterase